MSSGRRRFCYLPSIIASVAVLHRWSLSLVTIAGSVLPGANRPVPYAWAWAVTCIESLGAIMLAVGLFTRPVAFAMTVQLAVIAFEIMIKRGMFWTSGGIEVALLLGLVTFAYFCLEGSNVWQRVQRQKISKVVHLSLFHMHSSASAPARLCGPTEWIDCSTVGLMSQDVPGPIHQHGTASLNRGSFR